MLITEFDQERYDRHRREEGREEGRKEGREEGISMMIHNMSENGMAAETISQMTSIPLEKVREILNEQIPEG